MSYTVTSSSSQNKIRVCLAYTDAVPSTTVPSGTSTLMNKLSVALYATTDLVNPLKNTLTYPDTTNNVQMIEFANPSANTQYVIKVTANTLVTSPQSFALVMIQDVTPATPSEEFSSVKFTAEKIIMSKDNIIGVSLLSAIAFVLVLSLISMYYQKRVELYEPIRSSNSIPGPVIELGSLGGIVPTRVVVPQDSSQYASYSIDMNDDQER